MNTSIAVEQADLIPFNLLRAKLADRLKKHIRQQDLIHYIGKHQDAVLEALMVEINKQGDK